MLNISELTESLNRKYSIEEGDYDVKPITKVNEELQNNKTSEETSNENKTTFNINESLTNGYNVVQISEDGKTSYLSKLGNDISKSAWTDNPINAKQFNENLANEVCDTLNREGLKESYLGKLKEDKIMDKRLEEEVNNLHEFCGTDKKWDANERSKKATDYYRKLTKHSLEEELTEDMLDDYYLNKVSCEKSISKDRLKKALLNKKDN